MGWESSIRSVEAAERRCRAEIKRLRELERQAKEQAELSAVEAARLEVETYENRLDILLSVHKDQNSSWDWPALAVALEPPLPRRLNHHEYAVRRQACLSACNRNLATDNLADAQLRDQADHEQALEAHAIDIAELENLKALAHRILAGEANAYTQALAELGPFGELSGLGSDIHFTVHNPHLIEAVLRVNGLQAIPKEVKSLTAAGKLSVKPMPKTRFHELYQDHICSCILRIAREVFALLPVGTLIITAAAEIDAHPTKKPKEQPVLSAALERCATLGLDFDRLDPSDTIDGFLHRGDFKASRKTGAFAPITPLSPSDLPQPRIRLSDHRALLAQVRRLREDISFQLIDLSKPGPEP